MAIRFYNDLGLEKILVTFRHPVTREIVQFERDRKTPNLRPSHGYALVSQPIRAHGMRTPIGQVELHDASSSLRAKDLLEVAQQLDDLIQAAIGLIQRLSPPERQEDTRLENEEECRMIHPNTEIDQYWAILSGDTINEPAKRPIGVRQGEEN